MWSPGRGRRTVSCIACGERLQRSEAREYDKHGDRWEREGKEFEYLCKPCFSELSNAGRDGLEETLVAAGAGSCPRAEFLRRYAAASEDGTGADDAADDGAEPE